MAAGRHRGLLWPEDSAGGPEVPDGNEEEDGMQQAIVQNLEQLIDSDEAAVAAAATFCPNEMVMFVQSLISTDQLVAQAVHAQVNAVMTHRQETGQEQAMPQQSAAAAAVTNVAAEQLRQRAIEKAQDKIPEALRSIEEAEEACGGDDPDLQEARRRLQERTDPLARGAADAQRLVHRTLSRCAASAEKAIKKADRDVRDIVVLRCRACCADPKDRDGFLVKATEAYEGDLDKEVRAQLLLAYHKDPTNQQNGFVSNNQVAADRRGGPRLRRRRHASDKDKQASSGACSSHQQPGEEEENEYVFVADDGLQPSCCASTSQEPMFITLPESYEETQEDDAAYEYCLVPSYVLEASDWAPEGQEATAMTSSCAAAATADDSRGPQALRPQADPEVGPTTRPQTTRPVGSATQPTTGIHSSFNPGAAEFHPGAGAAQFADPAHLQYNGYGNPWNGAGTQQAYSAQANSANNAWVPSSNHEDPTKPPRNNRPAQQCSKGATPKHYRI